MAINLNNSLSAFKSRGFTLFWFSALISNSAQWMQQIVLPFIIFDMTNSNTWVGAISFTLLIPAMLLTPAAGVMADRVSRKKVLVFTTLIQIMVALGFTVLWQLDQLTPFRILGLAFMQGLSAGLQITNWQSLVPMLVPREDLFSAIRLNSAQFTSARAIGPLIGALLLATAGAGAVFLINALTYVILLFALFAIRPRFELAPSTTRAMQALKEGIRYVKDRPAIYQALFTAFAISFLGQSLVQLAAGLASDVYNVGELGLAGFVTASGVGTIFGASLIIAYGDKYKRSEAVRFGLAIYMLGPVLVGITAIYLVGLAGFFLTGVSHMIVGITLQTSIQSQIPEELRGRVISVYLLGVFGGIPMGAIVGGRLGDLIGLNIIFIGYGLGLALYLVVAIWAYGGHHLVDADEDTLESDEPA